MASNSTTLADQDGDFADWLELYNPDPAPANLGGWFLTNKTGNLSKWAIPAVTLPSGGYLVIFCSSKNYTDLTKPLATNFNISESGGYLALVKPDGKTVVSSYLFPTQFTDVSFGVTQPANAAETPQTGFFTVATPGRANGNYTNILLANRVSVSRPPGIFSGSITVALSGATGTQHIHYVLGPASAAGAVLPVPTAASPIYSGPITISSTMLLRAAVCTADDSQRGLPSTALYVQLDTSTANRLDTFASTLPLIVFDNHGFGLLPGDGIYHPAWTGVFSPTASGTATLVQTPDFFVPSMLKLHGYTSTQAPKQSYNFDLSDDIGADLKIPVMGMDSSRTWVSVATWNFDRTYIHDAFVYSLSNAMGNWAPRTRFAEVLIHSAGGPLDYKSYSGITTIVDSLKVATDRINVFPLSDSDVTAPNVTGGYVLRIDHPETSLFTWTTQMGVNVMLDTPKLDVLVKPQSDYITGYVQQMENALVADEASGYATHKYLDFLDRPSWVDYHLLNVFVKNVDAFLFSEYFTKDVRGLIKAGPVWDYDRCMGSADGRDRNPQQWNPTVDVDYWNVGWWNYLTRDPDFMQLWVDRWQSLRLSLFSNGRLLSRVNSLAAQIDPAAAVRDAARWPDDVPGPASGWSGEVGNMVTWLITRAQWIDRQFVAAPIAVAVSATQVMLTAPPGAQVVYTLDGSDPRKSGGGLSPTALLGNGPVTLSRSQAFLARSYNASATGVYPGSPWSSPVNAASLQLNTDGLPTGQLTNVSALAQVGAARLIDGFVIAGPAGATAQVLIRGIGPTLSQFGLTDALPQPGLSVFDSRGNLLATNTGWGTNANASALTAATARVGAFSLPGGSADSALLLNLDPGAYTLQVAGQGQSTGAALGEMYLLSQGAARIVNVSCRATVGSDAGALVTGFAITGSPATVLIRGVGPTLAQYAVSNALAQPLLQVFDARGSIIAANTGWTTSSNATQIAAAATSVGAFPLATTSTDSAQLLTLPPGAYTIQVSGSGGTSGSTLAESYLVPVK